MVIEWKVRGEREIKRESERVKNGKSVCVKKWWACRTSSSTSEDVFCLVLNWGEVKDGEQFLWNWCIGIEDKNTFMSFMIGFECEFEWNFYKSSS